jgi:hypothetical protein
VVETEASVVNAKVIATAIATGDRGQASGSLAQATGSSEG